MGYCIEMTGGKFIIKKESFVKALESLKSVFVPENMTCYDYIGGKKYPHFRWVDTKTVLDSNTLEEALEEIRYLPTFDENGNIYNVEFIGQKCGDEDIFFNALAPYVESGSFLSFEGENEATWKWVFNNGEVQQEYINNSYEDE